MSAPEPAGREPASDGGLTSTIGELAAPELVPAQRRRLLNQFARQVPRVRLWRPAGAVRWAVDAVSATAPHVPVRNLGTLHDHFPWLAGEALADRLVRNAALATAGVGAASGGLAAVQWAVPPTLLTAPVLLGVETVAVVAIEMKLIGELHEVYGGSVPGAGAQKAVALLQSWGQQRGVNLIQPGAGIAVALGGAARKELAERLARRFGRNLPTLAPLLAGAAVASYLNRRGTLALAAQLRADLRGLRQAGPVRPLTAPGGGY